MTASTGGGDCAPADSPVQSIADASIDQVIRDRVQFVSSDEFSFSPNSLIGSWFHRLENDQIVWQGVVVGEPAAGVYLISVEVLAPGAENVQRLIDLRQMTRDEEGYDWRFYDNSEECGAAYAYWLLCESERV
ncbi:hypothetical protein UFOVP1313_28 [uncultured Caudovirales phage]|uniref:Uncharacterized protein n=1 Tax=uncultured Caudovirales phage TaxID=2100421 RepID=A0A6J5RZC8_9CAUD|nr:hypothetical protein UFOVP1313_28 [uncultured Caudovirales phage]